jgi:hypothetical protein
MGLKKIKTAEPLTYLDHCSHHSLGFSRYGILALARKAAKLIRPDTPWICWLCETGSSGAATERTEGEVSDCSPPAGWHRLPAWPFKHREELKLERTPDLNYGF